MSRLDRVKQVVSDVFGLPPGEVSADSSPHTVEAWDSMGHLNLVLALEQAFGVQFTPEEIAAMTDVPLIVAALDAKLGPAGG